MLGRDILPQGAIFLAVALFLAAPAVSAAADDSAPVTETAPEPREVPTHASVTLSADPRGLCQQDIFEILKGGSESDDSEPPFRISKIS